MEKWREEHQNIHHLDSIIGNMFVCMYVIIHVYMCKYTYTVFIYTYHVYVYIHNFCTVFFIVAESYEIKLQISLHFALNIWIPMSSKQIFQYSHSNMIMSEKINDDSLISILYLYFLVVLRMSFIAGFFFLSNQNLITHHKSHFVIMTL